MAKNLKIIGNISEKDEIEVWGSKLQEIGIDSQVLYPASDYMSRSSAVCAPVAILWISSKSDVESFKIANERNAKGLSTINYFADAVTLSDSQKAAVGRNRSVFALVQPNSSIEDVIGLVDFDMPSTPSKSNQRTETSFTRKSEKKERLNVDREETSVVEKKASVSSPAGLNNHVQDTDKEGDLPVLPNENNKKVYWMPLVWYVCSILYYILIDQGFFTVWSDQTLLWLTVTAVFFVLAYAIARSTIAAIKRSKWCYLYIPFSLYMVVGYDLLYGFRLLSGLFD